MALTIEPDAAVPWNNRGNCHLALQRLEQAIDDYNRAIEIDPHYVEALNNRGFARQQQGDYEQALNDFRKAVQIDPAYHPAYVNAAWLRATCPDAAYRDGARAVQVAQQACDLTEHPNWYSLSVLAAAQAEAGDFEAAIRAQERRPRPVARRGRSRGIRGTTRTAGPLPERQAVSLRHHGLVLCQH